MKTFYITTPIYYPSGNPHLGHVYTTVVADVLARYKKLLGYEVFFSTGTDDHGQKMEEKAKALQTTPQALADQNAAVFAELWQALGISYDAFVRTSSPNHHTTVKKVFDQLLAAKHIYFGDWQSLYCVDCEETYTKTQAVYDELTKSLVCVQKHQLVEKQEPSYFLQVRKFSDWITNFIQTPNLIEPISRVNELTNSFLQNDEFQNLSISRASVEWGIKTNQAPHQTIYVWFDALLNYLSVLGYENTSNPNRYTTFWNHDGAEIVHVMSKEIIRFHCLYWPIILKMLNIKQPTKFLCHGWLVTKQGKMSKSLGNAIDPYYYLNTYGKDALRFFFCQSLNYKNDFLFEESLFISVYNQYLANNFGNLVSRLTGMLNKYCPEISSWQLTFEKPNENGLAADFYKKILTFDQTIVTVINSLDLAKVVSHIFELVDACNLLVEQTQPWNLAKNQQTEPLTTFLSLLWAATKRIIYYLQPILLDGCAQALLALGYQPSTFDYTSVMNPQDRYQKHQTSKQILYQRIS